MAYSAIGWLVIRLFLFSLAAGEDDSGSAENQDSADDVEDHGADAANAIFYENITKGN